MSFNDYFAHQWCINLERRKERWPTLQQRFAAQGVTRIQRFKAIDGREVEIPTQWQHPAGEYGCLQSHLSLVKRARAEGWPRLLILEDDAVPAPDFAQRIEAAMAEVPEDWDMLHLGAFHVETPQPLSARVQRITKAFSTYAYALNASVYDAFIQLNSENPIPVDNNNFTLQRDFKCYCLMPHLAWVDAVHSDTQELPTDPWWLKFSLVVGANPLAPVCERTLMVFRYSGRSPGNLIYMTNLYRRMARQMPQLVVATDEPPPSEGLPDDCTVLVGPEADPLQEIVGFAGDKDFVIVWDDRALINVYQFRACLLMCADYQLVDPFRTKVALDEASSIHFMSEAIRNLQPERFPKLAAQPVGTNCFFASRDGLEQLAAGLAPNALRTFPAPGYALNLWEPAGDLS